MRDARVSELRREIYGINESLRSAHETIVKLRVENAGLERRVEKAEEQEKLAKEAAATMKAELEKVTAAAAAAAPRRSTRSSSREYIGLATPEPQPGAFLSAGLARSGSKKGKKRRKYDSGLGFWTRMRMRLRSFHNIFHLLYRIYCTFLLRSLDLGFLCSIIRMASVSITGFLGSQHLLCAERCKLG